MAPNMCTLMRRTSRSESESRPKSLGTAGAARSRRMPNPRRAISFRGQKVPPSGGFLINLRTGLIHRYQPGSRPEDNRSKRSEEHTSELQSRSDLVCRLLLEKKKKITKNNTVTDTKVHVYNKHS